MAGNACPRLVRILIRLARNWAINKNRYERFEKRQRTAGDSAYTDDSEGEARWSAYHDDPFPDFVRLVDQNIGFGRDAIHLAALKEFDGERELVEILNTLDDRGVTAELFDVLRAEHPNLVGRLLTNSIEVPSGEVSGRSVLTDTLDGADKVFGLAGDLGRDFRSDFEAQGSATSAGEPLPLLRHSERIKEFVAAVLELSVAVQNPPEGTAAVVDRLRTAGRLAKLLSDGKEVNIDELFPDLNSLAEYGRQAVRTARDSMQPDDPFAAFDEPKVSNTCAVDAVGEKRFESSDFSAPVARVAELTSRPDDEAVGAKSNTKPRRRGRKKADYNTVEREAGLAAAWERARDSGTYKPDFARPLKMTVSQFDALLDRVAKRKRASE